MNAARQYIHLALYLYVKDVWNEGEKFVFITYEFERYVSERILENSDASEIHSFLADSLAELAVRDHLDRISDDWAEDHFVIDVDKFNSLEAFVTTELDKYTTYKKLGDRGLSWLGNALDRFIEAMKSEIEEDESGNVPSDEAVIQSREIADVWEPLPINRSSAEYEQVMEGLEKSIREIAADNGFATAYPAERDNLINHANVTLTAAKEGKVTKRQVHENIVTAGRWISVQFAGSVIGAAGLELVKLGLQLLGFIS